MSEITIEEIAKYFEQDFNGAHWEFNVFANQEAATLLRSQSETIKAQGEEIGRLRTDNAQLQFARCQEISAYGKVKQERDEAYEKVASIADAQQSCYRDDRVIAALRAIAVASRALKSKG